MRTDIIAFVFGSENRKKIVKTLFDYPKRQWSCSTLEDLTKTSHATVFRTLQGLHKFGLLKTFKINKKDLLYELVDKSPIVHELTRMFSLEKNSVYTISKEFVNQIKSNHICTAILYGSSVNGTMKSDSDIDILIILDKHNKPLENKIHDVSAVLSSTYNKTISPTFMDKVDLRKEQRGPFLTSVKNNMEVIYGKEPF